MKLLKNLIFVFLASATLATMNSCREDFESSPSMGQLEFSRDTVYLDTVFSNIGSSTYTLKVYNRSKNLINIPTLGLAQGESSAYRLNVDGLSGKRFENIELLPKDSLFIFVETTIDYQDFANVQNSFLYTDAIEFDSGVRLQKVELVTLVQDATFIFPNRNAQGIKEKLVLGMDDDGMDITVDGYFLDDDQLDFSNEKPYIIYGFAAIAPGKIMTIDAGARLHFHDNSGIIVANAGSLQVNGALSSDLEALENEVIFEGDRLEPGFSDRPGQWSAIWLTQGSLNNKISHATIKNATVGLIVDSNAGNGNPTLAIDNTQIRNSSNVALLAQNATIEAENLVINNAGISSLWLRLGGDYQFKHSTIVNYTRRNNNAPALMIDNFIPTGDGVVAAPLVRAQFTNCMVQGNRSREFSLDRVDDVAFNFNFTNCLLAFDKTSELEGNTLYDFDDSNFYTNVIIGREDERLGFKDFENDDFRISEESLANGKAQIRTAKEVPFDLTGTQRGAMPDIGAYESIVIEQ